MHRPETHRLAAAQIVPTPDIHAGCMVCGHHDSLALNFQVCSQGVEAVLLASSHWQGYPGVLHGGMICTLLDAAMTHCLFQQGIEAVTADLQVRFLKPAPCTGLLRLQASIQSQRRQLYQLSAELSSAGEVLARGEARFIRRKQA